MALYNQWWDVCVFLFCYRASSEHSLSCLGTCSPSVVVDRVIPALVNSLHAEPGEHKQMAGIQMLSSGFFDQGIGKNIFLRNVRWHACPWPQIM